jgi:hypothetical protein
MATIAVDSGHEIGLSREKWLELTLVAMSTKGTVKLKIYSATHRKTQDTHNSPKNSGHPQLPGFPPVAPSSYARNSNFLTIAGFSDYPRRKDMGVLALTQKRHGCLGSCLSGHGLHNGREEDEGCA